ncbi:hypothetical protein KI387_030093, partial [Taxus chinensis]
MASKAGCKQTSAIFGDDDYLTLDRLFLTLTKDVTHSDGSFTLCMWIYLLKSSKGGIIISQVEQSGEAALPFLTLDSDRKLSLFPALLLFSNKLDIDGDVAASIDKCFVMAELPCPLDKWVHIGCEVITNVIRLHIDGVVVGEKIVAYASQDGVIEEKSKPLNLVGADSNGNGVQGYAHYVRVLAQPAVTNHYVKNPPLELALDGSSGASDDHDLEEGGDGVWSVVGGKASCRRNFALDVILLDALGRSIHKDMELVALLVYADNGAPVEKPKDDAEAPLLTTFDGVEFPSTERPIRLLHGRASFKLKISQLSSKCDNRLFRVCFDLLHSMNYPFLRVFSRPIRCVSRNRNNRTPSVMGKKSTASSYQLDTACSPRIHEPTLESQQVNGDRLVHGSIMQTSKIVPPLKRVRVGHEKLSISLANETSLSDQSFDVGGNACNLSGNDILIPSSTELPKVLRATSPLGATCARFKNDSSGHPMSLPLHLHQTDPLFSTNLETKSEKFQEQLNFVCDNIRTHNSAAMRLGASGGEFTDYIVFKYCLDNMFSRSFFLKRTITSKSDQDVADFAARVSQYTGCHHNGYQISIAKQLIQEGVNLWKMLSKDGDSLPWNSVIHQMEQRFIMISRSTKRGFTAQDKEFLRRIAGCSETVVHEDFDRLWQWLFPVALSLSNPRIRKAWESMEPKWIEGMISREEAEALLRTPEGFSKPGSFIIRFPSSRSWPHPDAGSLIASYVDVDNGVHHRLLSLEERSSGGDRMDAKKPIEELLMAQPELSQVCR